jgi:hypothetical protein
MERRFPNGLINHMTGCYLIPKNLRNLTHDDTESLSVAFDADLPCKGAFSVKIERWRPKVGDHLVHQNISGLQSALKLAYKDYSYYFNIVDLGKVNIDDRTFVCLSNAPFSQKHGCESGNHFQTI